MSYFDKLAKRRIAASGRHRQFNGETTEPAPADVTPINQSLNTYTAVITSIDTAADSKVRIFGSSLGLDESYNTSNNAKVEIQESSHTEIKHELLSVPMIIKNIKISSTSRTQLSKAINIIRSSPGGSTTSIKKIPSNYKNEHQYDPDMVTLSNLNMPLDSNTRIEFDKLKDAEVTMQFEIGGKVDLKNEIFGQSALEG